MTFRESKKKNPKPSNALSFEAAEASNCIRKHLGDKPLPLSSFPKSLEVSQKRSGHSLPASCHALFRYEESGSTIVLTSPGLFLLFPYKASADASTPPVRETQ
ncbi:hypothetical protein CEXT_496111 [Caerostris extrusa]|uniref:Uncharacterized protein n=1 Tax=Caerostris extrusa TaxID=172846 RepID=A0AAV4UZF3_CAEEX|nr:hypothetical protein CEXT_496111 [Caerostris extrusa]